MCLDPLCPLQDSSGMSLSMLAAAGGQDDILRLLIKKGVKVNGRQKNGTTALMHAAEKVIIASLLKLCCSCCAALHSTQKTSVHVSHCVFQSYGGRKKICNNLIYLSLQNFLTTVAILLEAGSCLNAQTLGGETALMKVKIAKNKRDSFPDLRSENAADKWFVFLRLLGFVFFSCVPQIL